MESADGRSSPGKLTAEDPDTTSGLRLLGNDSVVSDRIGEDLVRDMRAGIRRVAAR
jgi:hypothetical protein